MKTKIRERQTENYFNPLDTLYRINNFEKLTEKIDFECTYPLYKCPDQIYMIMIFYDLIYEKRRRERKEEKNLSLFLAFFEQSK